MTTLRTALVGLAFLAGCEAVAPGGPGSGDSPSAMPLASDGAGLYQQYCAACHGEDARGGGPLARAMSRPPKDLTLLSVRHGDRFPTVKVLNMVDGYARSDLDGPAMPEFGELLSGDLVPYDSGDGIATPTPRRMVAIVEYLKTVQQTR